MKTVKREELIHILHITEGFLQSLEEEDLVHFCPDGSCTEDDLDRAALVLQLMNDLDVNLAGAEVILHMRQTMIDMQRQFGLVLAEIAREWRSQR